MRKLTGIRAVRARLSARLAAAARDQAGVSAVEFGLFAPMLVVSFLTMVDLGGAAYDRIAIAHVLRAGAQAAMSDPGATTVKNVMATTAANNFTVATDATTSGSNTLVIATPQRYCACADDKDAPVSCGQPCPGTAATPFAYYRLSATETYKGLILPSMTLGPSLQVEVR